MAADGKSISQAAGVSNAALGVGAAVLIAAVVSLKPHAPDLSRIAAAPTIIQVHLTAALTALAIGVALMMRVKGTGLHKLLGWTWVIAMGITAVSSLFIRELNHGSFSFIHLLSGWTIVALPGAVYAIRRRKVAAHRRAMTAMFVGGLLLAATLFVVVLATLGAGLV